MKIGTNGPLFFAPRDRSGNKKIWDENKRKYVVNKDVQEEPLRFAPLDSNGNKMYWNPADNTYVSPQTGQVYSVDKMCFVEVKQSN